MLPRYFYEDLEVWIKLNDAKQKRNQTFVYLYALAIIMVIDDHVASRIGILTSIFPYNSFYMPLFVFASGYFFKDRPFFKTLWHKVKKLYIPFLIYAVVFAIIACIIDLWIGTRWSNIVDSKYTLLHQVFMTVTEFPITDLNGASWYVMMIFWVSIIYLLIRKVIKVNLTNDVILMILLISLGFVAVYMCMINNPDYFIVRFPCKTIFFMQFYHLGYMFNKYGECLLSRFRRLYICAVCILINVVLLLTHDTIEYYATVHMTGFYNVYMPFVTSITGILFYYEIASFLAEKIGEVKLVSFIGRNTFIIMQVHLLFVNIPNIYIYRQIQKGSLAYQDFPIQEFLDSPWVRYYNKQSMLWGFCLGLIGSLIIAFIWEQIKCRLQRSKVD